MGKLARPLLLVAMLAISGACSPPAEPVRIGLLVWPPYELAQLALERDYADSSDIELVSYQTPAEMVRSYRFGILDAMFVTSQFALTNAANMADSSIIYVIDFSYGGDALLAQPSIESVDDLLGKRIGMEAGPLGAYTLVRALHGSEVSRDNMEIVFIDTPDQLKAFESGQVDAVATYEPTVSKLLKNGANELFNSRSIPLEIIDVLLVRDEVVNERPELLAELLQGLDSALADYRAEPETTASAVAARQGLTPAEFQRAMDGVRLLNLQENLALLSGTDPRLLRGLERQNEVMHQAGMLTSIPEIEMIIDDRIVEKAAR